MGNHLIVLRVVFALACIQGFPLKRKFQASTRNVHLKTLFLTHLNDFHYEAEPLINGDWKSYYRDMLGLGDSEFSKMIQYFLCPLPVGIRINPSSALASIIEMRLNISQGSDQLFFSPEAWQVISSYAD